MYVKLVSQSPDMHTAHTEPFRLHENTDVDHIQRAFAQCHKKGCIEVEAYTKKVKTQMCVPTVVATDLARIYSFVRTFECTHVHFCVGHVARFPDMGPMANKIASCT